jgi:hypothetical protein
MAISPDKAKAALDHAVTKVMLRDKKSGVWKALQRDGITTILDLVTMDPQRVQQLTYLDSNKEELLLTGGDQGAILAFLGYIQFRASVNKPIIGNDWLTISRQEYEEDYLFRGSFVYFNPAKIIPGSISQASIVKMTPLLTEWKKGAKRDASQFPDFSDDLKWDTWQREFRAQARTQGVHEILEPNQPQKGTQEWEVFKEKQAFMFSVFAKVLKTEYGLTLVRDHQDTYDGEGNAQKIYALLVDYYESSTAAKSRRNDILTYIHTAKLGRDTWNGTTESFLRHWREKVRHYESLCNKSERFSDDQKRTLLEIAVERIPDLRQVKAQAAQHAVHSGRELTFEEYWSLLTSAAQAYDKQLTTRTRNPSNNRRTVYSHDVSYGFDDTLEVHGIDTDLPTLQAYRAARLSGDTWHKLDPKDQQVWDMLSDDAKNLIIGQRSPMSNTFGNKQPSGRGNPGVRFKAKLHESSAMDPHDSYAGDDGNWQGDDDDPNVVLDTDDPEDSSPILAYLTKQGNTRSATHPAELSTMMSNARNGRSSKKGGATNSTKSSAPSNFGNTSSTTKVSKSEISIDGVTYYRASACDVYNVSASKRRDHKDSLVDRGANGGIGGDDVRVLEKTNRDVCIEGIDRHHLKDIPIATVAGVMSTLQGPVVGIFHQYAYTGRGPSIHSSAQLEAFMLKVDERSKKVGGTQRIITPDGYVIPLNVRNGLPYVSMRPPTDTELGTLPHVIMTSDVDWDPSVLDYELTDDPDWKDIVPSYDLIGAHPDFDEFGNYRRRYAVNSMAIHSPLLEDNVLPSDVPFEVYPRDPGPSHTSDNYPKNDDDPSKTASPDPDGDVFVDARQDTAPAVTVPASTVSTSEPDYESKRRLFAWQPKDVVQKTFETTTQYSRMPMSTYLKRTYRSPFPALNVRRRNEPVATDTVYSSEPAVDNGSTAAQLFVGTESLLVDVYPMKTDKQFVNTLEDNIRQRGAPIKLVSDSAITELSQRVLEVLRYLHIANWQSEPYMQHQNPAETRYRTVKRLTNLVLDRTGAPADTWLLAMQYVCFVLNFSACKSINWQVPMAIWDGSTPDISPLLSFEFYEEVYYLRHEYSFPTETREAQGYFVGIAQDVGHKMTYRVLTNDTRKVIHRSIVRTARNPGAPNKRAPLRDGEEPPTIVRSRVDDFQNSRDSIAELDPGETQHKSVPKDGESVDAPSLVMMDYSDLIGRTFLMDELEDGQKHRARIVEAVQDHEDDVATSPDHVKFKVSVNEDQYEEILSYNDIVSRLERDMEGDVIWKFRRITAHEGPLGLHHPNYKGSNYNVMVEWENGETTSEPLSIIAADDPVTCAIYARENDLLDKPGWKRFKGIAKRQKKLFRMANQAKLRSFNTAPRYKYGYEVPRTYEQAARIDRRNGNTMWQDATKTEMAQLDEYETFQDLGEGTSPPAGYKKIRVHLVFDVKHDGRHKARCVADGHLTDIPLDSVYSGVVSLRGIRLLLFLAELNQLETWATDIGNAYLEAKTKEKLYIIAGPEFGDREGHILVIVKALYGLRTSGLRWHQRFSACLEREGFKPCKAEPDIWMRAHSSGGFYEYVAVYVDDLAFAMEEPQVFVDRLVGEYKFKLKGTGSISFHLGCDFVRDGDGTLCMQPAAYIDRMIASYERMFGQKPSTKHFSPLEKGDHPEIDESELLDDQGIRDYQSLMGSLQWAVSLGRIDITTAVMTLSRFRTLPRKGHLDRAKRVVGYLARMKHGGIRFRTDEPDYSAIPDPEYEWEFSVYGDVEEDVPQDAPKPLGRFVVLTHYKDANLYHDLLTGRSVTGILHFLNKTPIDWFSKRQNTVETATYGSEFIAGRTCVEQVIDLRTTLRYLGAPIRGKSWMFGDNESVVKSSNMPHAKLHKRHNALSFHRVREAIVAGIVGFYHMPGESNPADILSKHWGFQQVKSQLLPLMFWYGDTAMATEDSSGEKT